MALDKVRADAEKKLRRVNLTDDFWVNSGYGSHRTGAQAKQYDAAVKLLTQLGYNLRFFYEERQFVNMYAIVEW